MLTVPTSDYREAPHNIEAEQGLLGALLCNNETLERLNDTLTPADFYDPLHAEIFDAITRAIHAKKKVNPVTLRSHFDGWEKITDDLTVPDYLGRLALHATTLLNVREYSNTVKDLALRRRLIQVGMDIVDDAYSAPVDRSPFEQIEDAEKQLFGLAEARTAQSEIDAAEMVASAVDQIDKAYKAGGAMCGLSTGLKDLDKKIGGLQGPDLVIVAGRPSMGKTALATAIIRAQEGPTHFFSQEMSAAQIGVRLISEDSDVPTERLRRGDLDEEAWRKVIRSSEKISTRKIIVDETGALTISQLVTRARRIKRRHDTSLIVVDYVQLMRGTKRGENRNLELGEITGGLKALAKELNVPVVALSQLSRDVEKRADKRPQLSDLRESGSIEQDADIVIFLYREEYYLERSRPDESDPDKYFEWMASMKRAAGKAEAIVAKNRQGACGIVPLQFDAPMTRFADLAREEFVPERFGGGHD